MAKSEFESRFPLIAFPLRGEGYRAKDKSRCVNIAPGVLETAGVVTKPKSNVKL